MKNTHPFSHCISSFEGISYKIYKEQGISSFISCFIIFIIFIILLFWNIPVNSNGKELRLQILVYLEIQEFDQKIVVSTW